MWGGERDNNGLWWRLRIRLLDPNEPQPTLEPWMHTAHLPSTQGGGEAHNANRHPPTIGTLCKPHSLLRPSSSPDAGLAALV